MENNPTQKRNFQKKKSVASTVPIRVNKDTSKEIRKLLLQINKKNFGRKLRANDVISLAVSKLTERDMELLQESSLSNADRLEREYRTYCSKNGQVSKDDYIGLLMSGKIASEPFLAQESFAS